MQIAPQKDEYLHKKLPIGSDETIIGIYRHHWFAYATSFIFAGAIIVATSSFTLLLLVTGGSKGVIAKYTASTVALLFVFFTLVLLGAAVAAYLKMQEQLVLTQESLLQILRPSIFTNKVDQVNLERVDDVSVHQDFFGTVIGYGDLTIETPGEQDNYHFNVLGNYQEVVREIKSTAENYKAALQSGQIESTLGAQAVAPQQPISVDSQQYQEFLKFQKQQGVTATNPQQPIQRQPIVEYDVPDGTHPDSASGQTPPANQQ